MPDLEGVELLFLCVIFTQDKRTLETKCSTKFFTGMVSIMDIKVLQLASSSELPIHNNQYTAMAKERVCQQVDGNQKSGSYLLSTKDSKSTARNLSILNSLESSKRTPTISLQKMKIQ